eukprot:EG_transcript_23827
MTRLAPLDLFYDVRVLSCFVPTIPLAQWRRLCNATFALHVFPKGREHPMQEQYEDVLNITWRGVPRLVVDSYLDLLERPLPDCLSVQWPACLLNGTLTPRSYPGDPPFGALAERSDYFRALRQHTIPAPHILQAAHSVSATLGAYLAVHVRVGDFDRWCKLSGRNAVRCPSFQQMGRMIRAVTQKHTLRTVFVACAPHLRNYTLTHLQLHNPHLSFHVGNSLLSP